MKLPVSLRAVVAAILYSLLCLSSAQASDELVFIFQKQKDPNQIKAAAEKVGTYLSNQIGIPVRVQVPLDYSASVQALVSKKADFAYVSSLPYLLARRDGQAEVLLVEQRVDPSGVARTEYDSVFVVPADSPLMSFDDLVKQAKDIRFVFTSATSTSGYIFPYSRFVDAGLLKPGQDPKEVFKSVQFGGGYTQAVDQVLAGRADVATVSYYVVEGDSVGTYLNAEQVKKIRILARTPGVPTHLVAARSGLSEEVKSKVRQALISLSKDQPQLLEDVYGTASFVEADGSAHVAKTVEAVERIKLPIENLQ